MGYVYFTDEQKERANSVDLTDFLHHQGERLLPSGREKRLASNRSITIRGNRWYDHACEKGGCSIDFVKLYYGKSFPDAVSMLLDGEQEQALLQQLSDYPQLKRIGLCLDNDSADIKARERIAKILSERGYQTVFPLFPKKKDWNEDLQGRNGQCLIQPTQPLKPQQETVPSAMQMA